MVGHCEKELFAKILLLHVKVCPPLYPWPPYPSQRQYFQDLHLGHSINANQFYIANKYYTNYSINFLHFSKLFLTELQLYGAIFIMQIVVVTKTFPADCFLRPCLQDKEIWAISELNSNIKRSTVNNSSCKRLTVFNFDIKFIQNIFTDIITCILIQIAQIYICKLHCSFYSTITWCFPRTNNIG